jgi:hypothetical protein
LTTMTTADHALLVDLVAFVDREHEYAVDSCHPQPGTDCATWCEACNLLTRVRDGVLAEARQQLRERGVDRD